MKYVALLRGINVGGNTLVKMSELKSAFEKIGYTNVVTYINSGNVIFESSDKGRSIVEKLEKTLAATFHYNIRVVVRSYNELKEVDANVPEEWKNTHELRCYIAFVKEPVTPKDVANEMQLKEGIDTIKIEKYVVYMSTKLSGLTKSSFTKLAGKKIYQDITIRNYNTVKKILALMNT